MNHVDLNMFWWGGKISLKKTYSYRDIQSVSYLFFPKFNKIIRFDIFLQTTTSHGIAVNWYLRVYWLLPFSIDDSFAEHRRLFFIAPTSTWASQSTSFPKGVFSLFQRTLFLFINWNCRQLGKKVVLNQQTPATRPSWFLFDKMVMPKIPNPSFLSGRARICACAIEGRVSMRRSLSLDWYPARKETIAVVTLPVPH